MGSTGWEIYAGNSDTKVYFRGSGTQNLRKNSVTELGSIKLASCVGFQQNGSLSLQVDGVN